MSNIQIMTDTVSCIPSELALSNEIRIVPAANILVGGQSYIEGVDLTASEAYELIKKDPDNFVTSAITPGFLVEEYRKFNGKSQDILFITISAALSAVSQSARLAVDIYQKESPETQILVVDSKTCAGAQGLVVLATANAAKNGMNLDELANFANQARSYTGGIMFLDTLRYIYRTGRMSKTASKLASIFNIRPINRVTDEGTVEFSDRVRKRSDGYNKVVDLIKKESKATALHFMVSHANAPQIAQEFSERLQREFDCLSLIISDFSPVMGYGAGPGALFVGFQRELDF